MVRDLGNAIGRCMRRRRWTHASWPRGLDGHAEVLAGRIRGQDKSVALEQLENLHLRSWALTSEEVAKVNAWADKVLVGMGIAAPGAACSFGNGGKRAKGARCGGAVTAKAKEDTQASDARNAVPFFS